MIRRGERLHAYFGAMCVALSISGVSKAVLGDESDIEILPGHKEIRIDGSTYGLEKLERTDFPEAIAKLNQDFEVNGFKLRVISCSTVVRISVETAIGNRSYGGLCSVDDGGKAIAVRVCADEMIGSLTIAPTWGREIFTDELVYFVASNCTGG